VTRSRWSTLLAVGGSTVLLFVLTSEPVARLLPFDARVRGDDFTRFWVASHSLISGTHTFPYKPGFGDFFYPAPYLFLTAPFGLLPRQWADDLARLLTAAMLAAVIAWWGRRPGGGGRAAWLLAVSLPAVQAVYLGQLATALGLAALSLAVLAQRRGRWWLVGLALAVAFIRPANALPVVAALAVGGWGNPRGLAAAAIAALLVLVPMVLTITLWDPSWPLDYAHVLGTYRFGVPALVSRAFGAAGLAALEVAACSLAVFWQRHDRGRPPSLDRSAAVLGMSIFAAPLTAAYSTAFIFPGTLVAMNLGWTSIVVLTAVVPWLLLWPRAIGPIPGYALAPLALATIAAATIAWLVRRPAGSPE